MGIRSFSRPAGSLLVPHTTLVASEITIVDVSSGIRRLVDDVLQLQPAGFDSSPKPTRLIVFAPPLFGERWSGFASELNANLDVLSCRQQQGLKCIIIVPKTTGEDLASFCAEMTWPVEYFYVDEDGACCKSLKLTTTAKANDNAVKGFVNRVLKGKEDGGGECIYSGGLFVYGGGGGNERERIQFMHNSFLGFEDSVSKALEFVK